MITYQVEPLENCLEEIKTLFEAHWEEVADPTIPLNPNYNKYLEMAKQGLVHAVTARQDNAIIGYHISFIYPHLHYQQSVTCFTDIFFIAKEHRKGFVGIRLFKFLEQSLKEKNVQRIYMGTKLRLDIGAILERLGYKPIERIYTKIIG